MKKLLVLLAALLATGTAGAFYDDDVQRRWVEYQEQYARYEVWIEVCHYTQYSCTGLAVPKVKYNYMRAGLLGRYRGGDTVYISTKLSIVQRKATMYHEYIHYLQMHVGGIKVPGPAKSICKAEAEAFAETDKRWVRMGMPWKQRGPDWWRPYKHCHQWYKPSWVAPIAWGGILWQTT